MGKPTNRMGTQLTDEQMKALRQVMDAVVESVALGGTLGTPSGILYASLMGMGCSLRQFEAMMAALVQIGKVRKEGHLYFAA